MRSVRAKNKPVIASGRRYDIPPADASSTRGRATSVRGRVRSPHISGGGHLQAASVLQPKLGQIDGQKYGQTITQSDESRYRLMPPPYGGGKKNPPLTPNTQP